MLLVDCHLSNRCGKRRTTNSLTFKLGIFLTISFQIKTRFQADFGYRNVRECVRQSLANEGHMMLWRGLAPTLLRYVLIILAFKFQQKMIFRNVCFFSRAFPNNAAVFATVTLFNRFVSDLSSSSTSNDFDDDMPTRHQTEFLMDTYDMHR